ncbi:MAG: 6-pyruvoyl-tetrahydropterin synthase-related protein, partial [Bacillota bacterium]
MVCFLTLAITFIFVLLKKISVLCYLYMILSSVFAGVLTAFWSLVGVTGFENPELPVMSPELSVVYSADLSWYLTLSSGWFYFAIPVSVCSILALLLYAYRRSTEKADHNENYYILYCALLTAFTILFSFGLHLPFFKYLPMVNFFLAARALILASATGAVLCAYLFYWIKTLSNHKKVMKAFAFLLGVSVMGATIFFMNPLLTEYPLIHENTFNKMSAKDSNAEAGNFEKGRYSYIGSYDSSESYFPILRDYNITEGWNIEGTPHYQAYRNFLIAIPSNDLDYIAKNLAFWNVRSILIAEDYDNIIDVVKEKYSFQVEGYRKKDKFYTSDVLSSYFLTDERNSLILGAGAPGVAIEFPYLVSGKSNDITDYTMEELEKYKIIYLCEPEVKTLQDKENIEARVEELIERGINVIIEPAIAKGYALFDVTVSDVNLEDAPIIKKQPGSRVHSSVDNISVDKSIKYGRALFGLDRVYYKLVQNNGLLENDIIGTKKARNGEVIFIGKHLSQYLKAVFTRNFGSSLENDD